MKPSFKPDSCSTWFGGAVDRIALVPNRNDRLRNAKRDRALAKALPPQDLYEAPKEGADEEEYHAGLMCGCDIVVRLVRAHGRLVEFAIMWVTQDGFGNWQEEYSVDTCHGYFHEHTHGHRRPGDRRDVRPLYSQVDVQECYDDGYDMVQDRHDARCRGGVR